jgi:TonB family protein
MLQLQKLALVALVFLTPAWSQSAAGDSQQQPPPSPQSPTQSDEKSSPDQTAPIAPADSTKLEPIKIEKATYPDAAREKQLQGEVLVKIMVSETGDVQGVEVISGDPILAKAAVEAAKKWKFKPFIKNGNPAAVSAKLPFDFAFSGNVHEVAPKRVRVSSGVSSGLLIHKVSPVYPYEARQARIQGIVLLQAEINTEGRIANLRLISGPPELASAAIGAVQQWRYRPYLLAGQPVEVETQIQVNFQLR